MAKRWAEMIGQDTPQAVRAPSHLAGEGWGGGLIEKAPPSRRAARTDLPRKGGGEPVAAAGSERSTGAILSLAYPERIAKSRGGNGAFLLANGRGANIDLASGLA